MESFLLKFHACISPKTAKYLRNLRFSRKVHHDSLIEGTKTSNIYRSIELHEIYRIDLFLLKFHACISPKTAKYLRNLRFSRKVHHDSLIEGTKTSNIYRSIELHELYRIDLFLLKFHACISPKTAKYLQNLKFRRKPHHDSSIQGTKTSNLYRSIELDELYRIVMTSFVLNHWIPCERANPRRSAEFVFS